MPHRGYWSCAFPPVRRHLPTKQLASSVSFSGVLGAEPSALAFWRSQSLLGLFPNFALLAKTISVLSGEKEGVEERPNSGLEVVARGSVTSVFALPAEALIL